MSKYKILALFGPSASGKDTIAKQIVSKYPSLTSNIVSCTTRPKRDYEKNGIDYHFISEETFTKHVLNGDMLEATCFREWFYGTPIWTLSSEKINVGVFNPEGIRILSEDPRIDITPIQICASDKIRLLRSLNREDNPDCEEICRRFLADKKAFQYIDFDYDSFENETNEEISKEKIKKLINKNFNIYDQNN